MKEGGGPKAEQIVLIFFVPIRGGGLGVNEFRTKSPNFTIFFFERVPYMHLCIEFYLIIVRESSLSAATLLMKSTHRNMFAYHLNIIIGP